MNHNLVFFLVCMCVCTFIQVRACMCVCVFLYVHLVTVHVSLYTTPLNTHVSGCLNAVKKCMTRETDRNVSDQINLQFLSLCLFNRFVWTAGVVFRAILIGETNLYAEVLEPWDGWSPLIRIYPVCAIHKYTHVCVCVCIQLNTFETKYNTKPWSNWFLIYNTK